MNRSESMNRYRCFESDISTSVESSHAAGALPQGFSGGSYWEVQAIGNGESGVSPPKVRRGGCGSKQMETTSSNSRSGVVPQPTLSRCVSKDVGSGTTPSAPIRSFGYFLDVAATPPNLGGDTPRFTLSGSLNLPIRAAREKPCGIAPRRATKLPVNVDRGYRSLRCAQMSGYFPRTTPWCTVTSGFDGRLIFEES
jgi:hypothetical protein